MILALNSAIFLLLCTTIVLCMDYFFNSSIIFLFPEMINNNSSGLICTITCIKKKKEKRKMKEEQSIFTAWLFLSPVSYSFYLIHSLLLVFLFNFHFHILFILSMVFCFSRFGGCFSFVSRHSYCFGVMAISILSITLFCHSHYSSLLFFRWHTFLVLWNLYCLSILSLV